VVRFDKGIHTLLCESFEAGKNRAKDEDSPEFDDWLRMRFEPSYKPEKKTASSPNKHKEKRKRWFR
jgi:hypothetical protein